MNEQFLSMSIANIVDYAKKEGISLPKWKNKSEVLEAVLLHNFSKMTVAELKEYATQEGILLPASRKKSEYVNIVYQEELNRLELAKKSVSKEAQAQKLLFSAPERMSLNTLFTGPTLFYIGTVCPKCGEEIVASFRTYDEDDAARKRPSMEKNLKRCPACGEKLVLAPGRFWESYDPKQVDSLFCDLHQKIASEEEALIREKLTPLFARGTAGKDMPTDNPVAKKVLSSTETLKKYILYLINIESELYLMNERMVSLRMHELCNQRNTIRAKKVVSEDAELKLKLLTYNLSGEIERIQEELADPDKYLAPRTVAVDDISIGIPMPIRPEIELPSEPRPPEKPVYKLPNYPEEPIFKKPGLFNKKAITEENEKIRKQYEAAVADFNRAEELWRKEEETFEEAQKEYNAKRTEYAKLAKQAAEMQAQYASDLARYNEAKKAAYHKALQKEQEDRIICRKNELKKKQEEFLQIKDQISAEEENNKQCIPQISVASFLSDEQKTIKKEIKQLLKVLDNLYSYNLIYGKYRNYAALTTIYEYLDSGRCSSLDGQNGAYNLLESESRANEVILQLNNISASLDTIKENQFMLYNEIKQINRSLQSIDDSMREVVDTLASIGMTLQETTSILSDIKTGVDANNLSSMSLQSSIEELHETARSISAATTATAHNTGATARHTALTAYYSAETAYYAKVNAEISEAIGFMIAMK